MQSFLEFINEGYAKGAGNIKNSKSHQLPMTNNPVAAGVNHADPTLEGLRTVLLDIFWPKAKGDKSKETKINQCVTTFVMAMDKKLRIDEEIVDMLADHANMSKDEVTKILSDEVNKYYSKSLNIYGMK
jgi:hypothetical protein